MENVTEYFNSRLDITKEKISIPKGSNYPYKKEKGNG
jgi:hypothetical protein